MDTLLWTACIQQTSILSNFRKEITKMPTYHLACISKKGLIISDMHISELININNLEDAEKILAAEFYTLNVKKCKLHIRNQDKPSYIREQYQEELELITKWFLEETPREFLRLNHFEVVEQ